MKLVVRKRECWGRDGVVEERVSGEQGVKRKDTKRKRDREF